MSPKPLRWKFLKFASKALKKLQGIRPNKKKSEKKFEEFLRDGEIPHDRYTAW